MYVVLFHLVLSTVTSFGMKTSINRFPWFFNRITEMCRKCVIDVCTRCKTNLFIYLSLLFRLLIKCGYWRTRSAYRHRLAGPTRHYVCLSLHLDTTACMQIKTFPAGRLLAVRQRPVVFPVVRAYIFTYVYTSVFSLLFGFHVFFLFFYDKAFTTSLTIELIAIYRALHVHTYIQRYKIQQIIFA